MIKKIIEYRSLSKIEKNVSFLYRRFCKSISKVFLFYLSKSEKKILYK
jgi:hypothetical protein